MRYPKFLEQGGTIGFAAPSYGCTIEPYASAFKSALAKFNDMGYKAVIGPNCYESSGIGISNKPEKCAEELMEMYQSADCDIIISCGGGELMCEILPFMDFEKIKSAEPKWFLGYSDNTNFTFTSTVLADTAAVYGPCAPTFGMKPWYRSLHDTWDILTGKTLSIKGYDKWEKESLKSEDDPTAPYNLTEEKKLVLFNGDRTGKCSYVEMNGRLLGGCLDTLLTLIGTPFDRVDDFNKKYEKDGIIWFLEACDLSVLQIRRGLWQMKNAGWFDNAKGFIFGRPYHFDEPEQGVDRFNAVTDILGLLNIPIVMDADIGHLPPSVPVISGAKARIEVKGSDISLIYSLD